MSWEAQAEPMNELAAEDLTQVRAQRRPLNPEGLSRQAQGGWFWRLLQPSLQTQASPALLSRLGVAQPPLLWVSGLCLAGDCDNTILPATDSALNVPSEGPATVYNLREVLG